MRIPLLHQHMAVEPAHILDGEHADAAEGAGRYRQYLALGDVGAYGAFAVTLQAVEGDGAGRDVPFQGAAGEVRLASFRLQQTVLNQLDPYLVKVRNRYGNAPQPATAAAGMLTYPEPEEFLAALDRGIPESSGCALGFDRIAMLLLDRADIGEVRI